MCTTLQISPSVLLTAAFVVKRGIMFLFKGRIQMPCTLLILKHFARQKCLNYLLASFYISALFFSYFPCQKVFNQHRGSNASWQRWCQLVRVTPQRNEGSATDGIQNIIYLYVHQRTSFLTFFSQTIIDKKCSMDICSQTTEQQVNEAAKKQ